MKTVSSCLGFLVGAAVVAVPGTARAGFTTVIEQAIQGGIATDGTGVATPRSGGSTAPSAPPENAEIFYPGWRPLQIRLPSGATIAKAYLAIHSTPSGLPNNAGDLVTLEGKLASAGTPVMGNGIVAVFDVTDGFGVQATKATYEIQEKGAADPAYDALALGVSGVQLVVLYQDLTRPVVRPVYWGVGTGTGSFSHSLAPLPGCDGGKRTVTTSIGILWQSPAEQQSSVTVMRALDGNTTLGTSLGGADDAHDPKNGGSRDLFTVGSFGADFATGAIAGVGGDEPLSEPMGSDPTDGRLSDELFSFERRLANETASLMFAGGSDGVFSSLITVVTQDDGDCDGLDDATDNCPGVKNQDQSDLDADKIGDLCDDDLDGDLVPNAEDNCPLESNDDQQNSDADPQGDICDPDDDNDSVIDALDNCRFVANTDQKDANGDGIGDACDPGGGGGQAGSGGATAGAAGAGASGKAGNGGAGAGGAGIGGVGGAGGAGAGGVGGARAGGAGAGASGVAGMDPGGQAGEAGSAGEGGASAGAAGKAGASAGAAGKAGASAGAGGKGGSPMGAAGKAGTPGAAGRSGATIDSSNGGTKGAGASTGLAQGKPGDEDGSCAVARPLAAEGRQGSGFGVSVLLGLAAWVRRRRGGRQ